MREALRFSAPPRMKKHAFIERIIALLELEELAASRVLDSQWRRGEEDGYHWAGLRGETAGIAFSR